MKKESYTNVSVANVYEKPDFKSSVVTQALLGETLMVFGEQGKWLNIRQWDGYEGWIRNFFVAEGAEAYVSCKTEIVIDDLFGAVYEDQNESSTVIRGIVYGNVLKISEKENNWYYVILPDGKLGWTNAVIKEEVGKDIRTFLMTESKRFLGIPYVWGGKTPKGFDCSGFIQTIMRAGGIELPRDAQQQVQFYGFKEIELSDIQGGDLIFFSDEGGNVDHVALSLGESVFIHSSGFVKTENFNKFSPGFNKQLYQNLYSVKSIEGYCN